MKKNILTEVNRMKEIMGLNLISENRAKRLLNLIVGATDEAIEATAKNTNFENYLKMTMDEFDEKVTKLGKQVSDLTDDEIFEIFKKNPKLKSKLDMAYKEAYHNAILELTKNIKIDTKIDDVVRQVSNYEVTRDNIDTIKDIYDQLEKGIEELINDIKSGKIGENKTVPQDLLDLSDMLKVKSDEIDNQDKLFDSQDYIGRIKSAAEEGGTSVIVDLGKEKL